MRVLPDTVRFRVNINRPVFINVNHKMSNYRVATQQHQVNDAVINLNFSPPYSQADLGRAIELQTQLNQLAPAASTVQYGWMPIPQYTPLNCPNGLQYLTTLDHLKIVQKVHLIESFINFEKNNKYMILNNLGEKVFYAVENTDCCTRNCCGSLREFEMKIMDSRGNEIIHLSRPYACQSCLFPCCLQKIEVYSPPGCLAGTVEQNWSLLIPNFTIRNAAHEEVLKIRGPICQFSMCGSDVKFKVLSKDKTSEVGCISKQWSGLFREMCTSADNFSVSFPMDLDVNMKAVMIGASFLIDFMFFERQK